MLVTNIESLIGNTPLVEMRHIEEENSVVAKIYGKVEFFNPSGSSKDRASLFMIKDAEKNGLKAGGTLIEPTSGNTGIGLAMLCAVKGYRLIIVMPDSMSVERRKMISGYGAEIVLTDGKLGMGGAVAKAEEINKEIEGSKIVGQFNNPANAKAHIETTGPEIMRDLPEVDCVIAGIGTGGTITGLGKFFKLNKPSVKIVGVEPASSPLINKGVAGPHKIQGIGANFIPGILDLNYIDEVLDIEDDDALNTAKTIMNKEGLSVGISAGAAVAAAIKMAKEQGCKNIVAVLPDSGNRYLSTDLFC